MRRVTWISDNGTTVQFGAVAPFFFNRLTDSVGGAPETYKAPRQDGQTTYHTSLEGRSIVLKGQLFIIGSKTDSVGQKRDRLRSFLARAFIPKTWGLLIYQSEDGDRQIRARPVATPTITEWENTALCDLSIDFVTDAPLWEAAELQAYMLGGFTPLFRFPWIPLKAPMGVYTPRVSMVNDWIDTIYPTIEIYTNSQTVTIMNETTGESLTLDHAIGEGQKLVIDMKDVYAVLWERDASGTYRELEDVSHWITLGSSPWGLVPGENMVFVHNENPNETPIAYIMYRSQFAGV